MSTYRAIGLMSGTSLDGIDMAYCHIRNEGSRWGYEIVKAQTLPYSTYWKDILRNAQTLSGYELNRLDTNYGNYLGELSLKFIHQNDLTPDFIASHGHTVFHQPQEALSLQIGKGSAIAGKTKLPVVCDFRSLDVALGGQGAPLVPIGDKLFFGHHEFCLNLGGFANISVDRGSRRIAFDICPANIALNQVTQQIGKDFDANGQLAKTGQINQELLNKLNSLYYYEKTPPKSLGREWYEQEFLPLVRECKCSPEDKLRTLVEHIALQIVKATHDDNEQGSLFITGGGAYNNFLVHRINANTKLCIEIPDDKTIQYKEALLFALIGVLRMEQKTNVLSSVTGSLNDHSGGIIYHPH